MNTDAWDIAVGAAIICALADLTENERHAVVGRHIRGLTHQALADERHVSRSAVFITEQRGLAKLAKTLKPLRHELLAA